MVEPLRRVFALREGLNDVRRKRSEHRGKGAERRKGNAIRARARVA